MFLFTLLYLLLTVFLHFFGPVGESYHIMQYAPYIMFFTLIAGLLLSFRSQKETISSWAVWLSFFIWCILLSYCPRSSVFSWEIVFFSAARDFFSLQHANHSLRSIVILDSFYVFISSGFAYHISITHQTQYYPVLYYSLILYHVLKWYIQYLSYNLHNTPALQNKICFVIREDDKASTLVKIALEIFPQAHTVNLSDYQMYHYKKSTKKSNATLTELTDADVETAIDQPMQDDFEKCIQTLLSYELIIFITPVYWYSTSSELKIFFDRLADLLYIEKYDKYKQAFRQKKFAAMITYSRDQGYAIPIIAKTCQYLKGLFVGSLSVYRNNRDILNEYNFKTGCINSLI